MELKNWSCYIRNIIFMVTFILIMATANIKMNKMETQLNFYILPIFLGILFGTIIKYLSMKRTRYLDEKIREKTKELEYYATMDNMTNTYNRRMGLKMLEYHFVLSKRRENILSICYIDINGLKSVNDNFGHIIGDELIRDTSEMLRSSVRETDIIARMGGDEFMIILPESDTEGAKKVMRRLTEKIEIYNGGSQKDYRVSVSFGLSECSYLDERTIEELLVEADNKMYAMKKESKKNEFLFKNKFLNFYEENEVSPLHSYKI